MGRGITFSRGYKYGDLTYPLEVTIEVDASDMRYDVVEERRPYPIRIKFTINDDDARTLWKMMCPAYMGEDK